MAAPRPLSLWPLSAFWSDRDPRPDPWLPQGGDLKPGLWSQTCVLSLFSRVLIFATLYSLSGSSVQARILEWVAISFSRNLPNPGIELSSLMPSALPGRFFITSSIWEYWSQTDLSPNPSPAVLHRGPWASCFIMLGLWHLICEME